MTPRNLKMTPLRITEWALANGWRHERNHLHKVNEATGSNLRLVIQDRSVRIEARVDHSDGTHSWARVVSGFFKNITIGENGKLGGLKR